MFLYVTDDEVATLFSVSFIVPDAIAQMHILSVKIRENDNATLFRGSLVGVHIGSNAESGVASLYCLEIFQLGTLSVSPDYRLGILGHSRSTRQTVFNMFWAHHYRKLSSGLCKWMSALMCARVVRKVVLAVPVWCVATIRLVAEFSL